MEETTIVKTSELTELLNEIRLVKEEIKQLREKEETLKAYSIQQTADMLNLHYNTVRNLVIKRKLYVQKNQIGITDKTEIVFNNLGHPDKVQIMDESGKNVLFDVNGGTPFKGEQKLRFSLLYESNPSFSGNMTITVKVTGGNEVPTAFYYNVYNSSFVGGNLVIPNYPKTSPKL